MSLDAQLPHLPTARSLRAPLAVIGVSLTLLVGATITARVWLPGFVVLGLALVGLIAYAAVHWPRAAMLVVVLAPVFDRYLVGGLLPPDLAPVTHLLSEGLLVGVGLILAARAWRDGRLIAAFRHPVTLALIAFVALALVSTLLNGVPPLVVALGLIFTVDAAALFFYPRLVGFSPQQALLALGAIVALVALAALIAALQALLSPTLFGLSPVAGRFGEVYRIASIFDDPNVFGAFLVAAAPFMLLAATKLPARNLRWAAGAIAFVLVLALWLSFSRGAWLALIIGPGVVLAILDRRTLVLGTMIVVVTFATAVVMPRDLLVARAEPGEAEQPERPELVGSTLDRVGTIGTGQDLRTLFVLNAMPILADHPVLGVGPGRYGGTVANTHPTPIYAAYETDELFWNPTQRTVDNFWLHILVEGGVLGFAALLGAALIPGIRILRAARSATGWNRILLGGTAAASVGLAVSSVSTMLLEANSVGFLFWFLLGVGALVAAATTRATPAAA